MATSTQVEALKLKFEQNPRRYFAPLANELRKSGDLTQAIAICRSHLPNQPAHVSGHIVLAQALFEAGEVDASRQEFKAALELDPENLIALRQMGDIARNRGEFEGARSWYGRVLDADPRNHEIAQILSQLESVPDESRFQPPTPAATEAPDPLSWDRREDNSRNEASAAEQPSAAPASEPQPQSPESEDLDLHGTSPTPHLNAPQNNFPHGNASPTPPGVLAVTLSNALDAHPLDTALGMDVDDFAIDASESGAQMPSSMSSESVAESQAETDADLTLDPAGPDASPLTSPDASLHTQDPDREPAADLSLGSPWPHGVAASELSDLEAAPERWFEEAAETGLQESGPVSIAPAADAASEMSEEQIEALFDAPPSAGAELPSAEAEASNAPPPADSPERSDEVDAAFRDSDVVRHSEALEEPSWSATPEVDDRAAPPAPLAPLAAAEHLPAIDAVEPDPLVGPTPAFSASVPEGKASPFVTETLAELYMQQGFVDEALAIYRQLLARNPSDDTLRNRIASIERGAGSYASSPVAASRPKGNETAAQSVRTFFGRLARRAPHTRSQVQDVSASSLSALFSAPVARDDAAAASTLAAAFGSDNRASTPRPSRVGERELSLDHLFQDSPPPDAGPVSIDEFYAAPGTPTPATANGHASPPEDERNADIRQFTSWLEGLKKK